ncbi:MAG TPA: hypothetical protein VHO46_16355 [Bacteroidales bacterium]|nr:hypothetical protein [Bacteroidales bacterium]
MFDPEVSIEAGAYMDFETGKFDVYGLDEQSATRIGIGTIWIGHYPDKMLRLNLCGYFGYNTAFPGESF